MRRPVFIVNRLLFLMAPCAVVACVPPAKPPKDSVTLAIEERAKNPRPKPDTAPIAKKPAAKPQPAPKESGPLAPTETVATIGTAAISRDDLVSLLVRSRGVPVLEQLVGLAATEELARKRGVAVSEADVDFEYELALRRLWDPLAFSTTEGFDKNEAERLLDSILSARSMSREEFMVTVRRNAVLRRVLAAELTISDEQLRAEYDLAYGDRVQIRHIQLGSLGDATRIKERLAAGEDFAELAARFTTNATTARRGGLLDPFSTRDEFYPLALRQAAEKLEPGQVSEVIRVGEWYQIIKMERRVPPQQRGSDSARELLMQRVVVRQTDPRMRELHDKLMRDAKVEISDPLLKDLYFRARRGTP